MHELVLLLSSWLACRLLGKLSCLDSVSVALPARVGFPVRAVYLHRGLWRADESELLWFACMLLTHGLVG